MTDIIKIKNKKTGQIVTLRRKSNALDTSATGEIRKPRISDVSPAVAKVATTAPSLLPVAGQIAGGILGTPGGPLGQFAGSVAGATTGKAAEMGIRNLFGGDEFDKSKLAREAIVTGVTEGTFHVAGASMFKKLRLVNDIEKGIGVTLNKMKTQLAKSSLRSNNLQVPMVKMMRLISRTTKRIVKPRGKVATVLRDFKSHWFKAAKEGSETIPAHEIMQFKQELGNAIQNDFKASSSNLQLNKASKTIASKTSEWLEEIADQAGVKNFRKVNRVVSKKLGKLTELGADSLGGVALAGTGGAGLGMITGNPLLGLLSGAILIEGRRQPVRKALYKAIEKTGVGRVATVGLTEGGRKLINKFTE